MSRNIIVKGIVALGFVAILSGCASKTTIRTNKADIEVITDIVTMQNPQEDLAGDAGQDSSNPTSQSGPRIICWGDSLTECTGGNGVTFPKVIEELSGIETLNYGVFGETSALIAGRQGGNPMHVEKLTQIPAEVEPVPVAIIGDDGSHEYWCNYGDAGINPCVIAGVEGRLYIDMETGTRYFERATAGEAVSVKDDGSERFYTHAMLDKRDNDILVIWSGANDGWDGNGNIDDIVKHINQMIDFAGCEKYVVMNMISVPAIGDRIDSWNERLASEYGEHYMDIRSYLLNSALNDLGIEPTEQDKQDISQGMVPQSLRSDEVHGTADMYRLVGNEVYKKLAQLGYI